MKRISKKPLQKSPLHSDNNLSRFRNQGEVDSVSDSTQGASSSHLQNHSCSHQNLLSIETGTRESHVQEYETSNRSRANLPEIDVDSGAGSQSGVSSPLYQNSTVVCSAVACCSGHINHTDNHRKREKMGILKNLRRKFSSLSVRKPDVDETVSYGHIEEQQSPNRNLELDLHTSFSERPTNSHLALAARCDCSPKSHSIKSFMSPKFSEWHSNTDHRGVEIARDKPGCVSKDISKFNSSASSLCKSGGHIKKDGVDCGSSSVVNGTNMSKGEEKHYRNEPVYELADCVEYDPVKEQTRIWSPKVWSLTQELFRLSKFGWYWGPITRNEAEDKLTNQPDGAFLVRDSSDERYLLSLSFRSFGRTLHTRIEHCNGMFSFYAQPDTEGYPSIVDLIERSMNDSQTGIFYYSRSRSPEADKIPVRLTKPVSRFTQVQSLQHMCRFVIRQYTRYDHIQQLPLPNSLKALLSDIGYWNIEHPLWVGARDGWTGVSWEWSDNTPMSYFKWGNAEPQYVSDDGDNCGYIPVTSDQYKWKARTCGDKLGYICKAQALEKYHVIPSPPEEKERCSGEPLISGYHSLQFPADFTSSSFKDKNHKPEHCRMIPSNTASWRPAQDSHNEWLSITFHSPATISSLLLRGDVKTNNYVSRFKLQYQFDSDSPWNWVKEANGTSKVFEGVTVQSGTATIILVGDIIAQSIKIWPVAWVHGIALQIEIIGCMEDLCQGEYSMSDPLILPRPTLTASSVHGQAYLAGGLTLPLPVDLWGETPAWMPQSADISPWIQVTFNKPRIIRGLTMSGDKASGIYYVSKFQLQFSPTGQDLDHNLVTYTQPYGVNHTFNGPSSASGIQTIYLKSSIVAQVVRIVILDAARHGAALKFDILSCRTGCRSESALDKIPAASLTASDSLGAMTPDRSRLNANWRGQFRDGWSPKQNKVSDSSYIQVDLGSVKHVTTVATQGSIAAEAWVKSYYLAFSLDGKIFKRYGEKQSLLYQANLDSVSIVKNELDPPVNARFVQLWPHDFHSSIALRWDVFTCPNNNAVVPIGCYSDDPFDPDLKIVPPRDQYSSIWPEACLAQCYDLGYPYAGLQSGDRCSCGSDYGVYGKTDGCDIPCQAPYTDFKCGGVDKNAIFSTGIASSSSICPRGYHSFRESCYLLVTENTTWLDARARCSRLGGQLVDIGDSDENQVATGLLNGRGSAWIGLNDIEQSLNFRWSGDSQVYYTNWGKHQPTVNPGLEQRSVLISAQDGTWSNAFSEGLYPYICETLQKPSNLARSNHQDVGCKKGWLGFGNKCYQVNRIQKSWDEAKSLCTMEQASLARVENLQENIFLSTAMVELSGRYWTDASALNYKYLHDTKIVSSVISFTNWAPYKPDINGGCVSLGTAHHAGEWANEPCKTTNPFICEETRPGMSTSVSSSQASPIAAVCPTGWIDSGDGMCYQVNSVADNFKVTWHEASDDCKKKGTNLASFHSDDQFLAVLNKIGQFGSEAGNFWCGLHNFDLSKGYAWEDQSVMDYVRWHSTLRPGEGRCGEIRQVSSDLAMLGCLKRRSWVCGAATGTNIIVPSVEIFPQPEKFGACDPLPRPWRKFKDSCYFFADGTGGSDDSLTWREARESCRRHGANLVSIDSDEENRFLQGMLTSGSQKSSVWIGLNELDGGLGYSWSNGNPLRWKLNWNVNEPNDYGGNEACVEMVVRNGRWNDQHCSVRQGFVCEQPAPGVIRPPTPSSPSSGASNTSSPQSGCPKGFSKFANKCYGVFGAEKVTSRLTWAQANVACSKIGIQSQHAGLASITSALENAFVTSLLRKHRVSSWLGLRRTPDGQYRWWDNQDFSFQHWNHDEPNMPIGQAGCVYIYGPAAVAGKWNDVNCQELAAYVCQVDTDPKFSQVFKPPSSRCSYREGFQLYGDSCLKLSKNTASWPEAEAECLSSMSNLVSVMDAYDQAKLFLLAQIGHSDIWLGLSDQMTPGTFVWSSGYPVLFAPWASGQPTKQSCVYMDIQGNFNSASCSQGRSFVCRSDDEPPQAKPNPPGGYCKDLQILGIPSNYTESGSLCYYFVSHMLSYTDASYVCRVQGGNLASIHDLNLQSTGLSSKAWIGMRKSIHGSYYWLDDSPVDFINWAPGYPRNKDPDDICVFMATDGTWYNDYCSSRLPFLCAVSKVYPTQTLSLPAPEMTPPQFKNPTTQAQEIPTKIVPTSKQPSSAGHKTTQSTKNVTSPSAVSDVHPGQTNQHSESTTPGSEDKASSTRSVTRWTSKNRNDEERSTNTYATSMFAAHVTLAPLKTGSSRLTAGDKAAIGLGVIVAVLIAILAAFAFARFRSNNGSFFRRSFLRRELSRAKNFENSLYEETRKDTLTSRERVETLTVETLSLGGPGSWPETRGAVSISLNSQSGQDQSTRPGVALEHGEQESHMNSPNSGLWMASKSQEDKFLANGTHGTRDAIVIQNETAATLVNNLPDQMSNIVESQA